MNTPGILERKEKCTEESRMYFNAAPGWRNILQREECIIVLILKIHTEGTLRNNETEKHNLVLYVIKHNLQPFQIKFRWVYRGSILHRVSFRIMQTSLPCHSLWHGAEMLL